MLTSRRARIPPQSSDYIEKPHTVGKLGNPKFLQVLVRQAPEDRFVYVIIAEDRLILCGTTNRLVKDEARRIAANIVKLAELLRRR